MVESARSSSILVIDDSPEVRLVVERMLSRAGFIVRTANGGRRGLARLTATESIDIVLLDVHMPDLNGWETLVRIRSDYRTDRVLVIMCTSESRPEAALLSWTLGCDGYVLKPVDSLTLVAEIRAAQARDEMQRQVVREEHISRLRPLLAARTRPGPDTIVAATGHPPTSDQRVEGGTTERRALPMGPDEPVKRDTK